MEAIQTITIEKLPNGTFSLIHKHGDFTREHYSPRSIKGTLHAVESLLNGYQPYPADLLLREGEERPKKLGWDKPRPID